MIRVAFAGFSPLMRALLFEVSPLNPIVFGDAGAFMALRRDRRTARHIVQPRRTREARYYQISCATIVCPTIVIWVRSRRIHSSLSQPRVIIVPRKRTNSPLNRAIE